jgi:hypothetical protein
MTIHQPERTSLFATVATLVLSHFRANGFWCYHSLKKLCETRPEAIPVVQACLLDLELPATVFTAVCAAVPGMDLELLEQRVVSWDKQLQIHFCKTIVRDYGPVRDMLNVEHVMES